MLGEFSNGPVRGGVAVQRDGMRPSGMRSRGFTQICLRRANRTFPAEMRNRTLPALVDAAIEIRACAGAKVTGSGAARFAAEYAAARRDCRVVDDGGNPGVLGLARTDEPRNVGRRVLNWGHERLRTIKHGKPERQRPGEKRLGARRLFQSPPQ